MKKLSDKEMDTMFELIQRYSLTEMDQFDLWKFKTKFGYMYVTISMSPGDVSEEAYHDITDLLPKS